MAQEDVNIKVSANVAEAIRLWKEMSKGPQQMAGEMASMGKKGKAASKGITGELAKMAAGWISVQAGIGLAKDALQFFIRANKEAATQSRDATKTIDQQFRLLRVQAALGVDQEERAATLKRIVGDSAKTAAVSFGDAANVARSLISTGFSLDQVEGGGLDVALQAVNATNVTGKSADLEQFTRSIVQLLNATGQQKTPENFRKAAIAIQSQFRGGNLEPQDLVKLAENSSKLTQFANSPLNEQLALLTTLRETKGGAQASVSLGNIAQILGTASSNPAALKALKQLGIKPEEVDFEGENYGDVLDVFKERLSGLTPEQQKGGIGKLFGRETAGAFIDLLQGREKFRQFQALGNDEAGYNEAVAIATSGTAAAERRVALAKKLSFDDAGLAKRARLPEVLATKGREAGLGNARILAEQLTAEAAQAVAPDTSDSLIAAFTVAVTAVAKKALQGKINPTNPSLAFQDLSEIASATFRADAAVQENTGVEVSVTGTLTTETGAEVAHISSAEGSSE